MSIYYKHLNLSIPVLNDSAPLDELKSVWQCDMNKQIGMHLHPLFMDFLKNKNVCVSHIESFFSRPNINLPIHADLIGDYIKINYIIGGVDSVMHWYTVKSGTQIEPQFTKISTKYFRFKADQVELADTASVSPISIVQVGVPHTITNPVEYRLCISMCISHCHNHQRLTMNEATEVFAEHIINRLGAL